MDVSSPISPSRAMTSYMEDQLLRPLGYDVHQHDITMDPAAGLAAILEDIDGRQADGHGMQAPARLVLILSPDRARSLRRSDRLSDPSSAGKALLRILDEGPEVGVHTVLFAETVSLLDTVIEMRRCPCILHRVAFEMNETESFKFIGTQAASKVQSAGARPIAALYVNMERATRIRFKPFSPVSDEPITRQIDEVRQQLAHRMGQQQ
jgi:hypothetical protein